MSEVLSFFLSTDRIVVFAYLPSKSREVAHHNDSDHLSPFRAPFEPFPSLHVTSQNTRHPSCIVEARMETCPNTTYL